MNTRAKQWVAMVLCMTLLSSLLPIKAQAGYQPNGWSGTISWTGHGALVGHYATTYSSEKDYSRGIICLEPTKSAVDYDYSYGEAERIIYGSDPWIARIGYYANAYAAMYNYDMYHAIPAWAVATGLVYDKVEGRAPAWGKVEAVYDSALSMHYFTEARDWIVGKLEHFEDMPKELYLSEEAAKEAPLEMTKRPDGSFAVTLTEDALWNTAAEWQGFSGFEGTMGEFSLNGAAVNWTRSGGKMTFSVTAEQAARWTQNGGYSGVLTFVKRMGDGSANSYEVWKSSMDNQQMMMYAPSATIMPMKGYLAFHAEVEQGHAYFTKSVESDEELITLCPYAYSLDGTEITIYDSGLNQVSTLTIQNGKTPVIDLEPGAYYYEETKAADGFERKTGRTMFQVKSGETFTADIKNRPLFDPLTLVLRKTGTVNGEEIYLENAEFTVFYFPEELTREQAESRKNSALFTWVFTTDSNGGISYDEAHLSRTKASDPLFVTEKGEYVGLPGTYLFTETMPPAGFTVCEPFTEVIRTGDMSGNGSSQWNVREVKDDPQRIYLEITKVNEAGERIPPSFGSYAGAVFQVMILDQESGTYAAIGTITTGADGKGSMEIPSSFLNSEGVTFYVQETKPSPGCLLNPEIFEVAPGIVNPLIPEIVYPLDVFEPAITVTISKTGLNETGILAQVEGADMELRKEDGLSVVDAWTTNGEIRILKGLPAGVYYLYETNVVPGYLPLLEPVKILVEETDEVQSFTVMNERIPEIHTIAAFEDGSKMAQAGGEMIIIDQVDVSFLSMGERYTLRSMLADAETGEILSRGVHSWVADIQKERIEVQLTVDTQNLNGRTLVVLEELYEDSRSIDEPVAVHTELGNKAQQVSFPVIHTRAADDADEDKVIASVGEQIIRDSVKYYGLAADGEKEYTIHGVLMNGESGEAVLDAEGKEITASITFIPEESEGEVILTFAVDASLLGSRTVVFENLYEEELLICTHSDLDDADQSVYKPSIRTMAASSRTGEKVIPWREKVELTDTVLYENLLPETEYVLITDLMVCWEEEGVFNCERKMQVSTEFTTVPAAEGESLVQGSIEAGVSFEWDEFLEGKTLVFYETLEAKETGITEAEHKDPRDEDQSIHIPALATSAAGENGTDTILSEGNAQILDTVCCENLPAGEYRLEGEIMKRICLEDGSYAAERTGITAECVFDVPQTGSGSAVMEFLVDASLFAGCDIVVYETLKEAKTGTVIASHEDIYSQQQDIHIPKIQTSAMVEDNGSHMAPEGEEVTVVDRVYLEGGLVEGRRYEITGVMMDKDTGKALILNGKEVSASISFVFEEGMEWVELAFSLNTEDLDGKVLVAFETLWYEGKEVALHADIEDEQQTIYVPRISTSARTEEGNRSYDRHQESVVIVDTVQFSGLEAGKTYHLVAQVMDGQTGEALERTCEKEENGEVSSMTEVIMEELFFIPEGSAGEVQISVTVPLTEESGNIVVFEKVYLVEETQEYLVGRHEDLSDREQTVHPGVDTGDVMRLSLYAAMALGALCGLCLTMRRKMSRKQRRSSENTER